MMTNRRNGTLDTGVTDNLARRAWEHRAGLVAGFTKKHGLKMFVYVEEHDGMLAARQREQNIKHWPRGVKGPANSWPEPGLGGSFRSAASSRG